AADAMAYFNEGSQIVAYFQALDFTVLETYRFQGEGTTWMIHLTALTYLFLPPSLPGSFLLFAGLAFAGSVLYYRSYRLVFSGQDSRLFLVLTFFSPSVLFWPSSLGKDAWIYFCTALVVWGWAK